MKTARPTRSDIKKKRVIHKLFSLIFPRGSLLLEAIISIGIFALFLGSIGLSLILGERSTIISGDRTRAAFYAEQQLEAVRQMRITNFSSITPGTHGLKLGANGWSWLGTEVKNNGYTSWVTVTPKGTDWLEIASNVKWNFGNTRSGSILMTTQLTNWNKIATVGNWSAMTKKKELTVSGTPQFQSIAISGTFAYVTSKNDDDEKGLYIFDISNPANPVRVASTFNLGASAYGVVAAGNRLYLTTTDEENEVKVFNITDPANLTTGNLIGSYNIQGSRRARSLAVYGNIVFVGRIDTPQNNELTALQMSKTGLTFLSELTTKGSVLGISLSDSFAYIANSYNVGELQVVDIFNPAVMVFAPNTGIDMPDVQDGISIALTGTSALIGRVKGAQIAELTLYDISRSPVPSPPPGPWTLETDGDVLSIVTIFGSKYAFIGGSMSNNQIRVLDLVKFVQGQPPVVKYFDTAATIRGLFYDWQTDHLFAVSDSALFVFIPG